MRCSGSKCAPELKAVLAQAGTTTVYVTHDQTEAMGLADRIALMHEGVIEQIDRPQTIYERPATKFVGGFVGNPPMNFITLPVRIGMASLGGSRRKFRSPMDPSLLGSAPRIWRSRRTAGVFPSR